MPKHRVLVDTCIIIEAFRINCWSALCKHFDVETVECCVIECSTGDMLQPGRVQIPDKQLLDGLACVHGVDETMLAMLTLDCPNLPALDDGELHLMAWLHAHPKEAVLTAISTADRAAVPIAVKGWHSYQVAITPVIHGHARTHRARSVHAVITYISPHIGNPPCLHTINACSTWFEFPRPILVLPTCFLNSSAARKVNLPLPVGTSVRLWPKTTPGEDLLMDIATEELSHLEIIGNLVAMLNKGAKGKLSEAVDSEAEIYKGLNGPGNDSHTTQLLYGGGPALTNHYTVNFLPAVVWRRWH